MVELIKQQIEMSDQSGYVTFTLNDVNLILNHIEQLEHKIKMLSL